jgi:hypothetical protein
MYLEATGVRPVIFAVIAEDGGLINVAGSNKAGAVLENGSSKRVMKGLKGPCIDVGCRSCQRKWGMA